MVTQLRSTRHLSIAGETLDWTEIDPYVWELAFPSGPVIGQIVEIPAHGRNKQTWRRSDTGQPYQSVMTACSDLLTDYYRKQAQQPAPTEDYSGPLTLPAREPVAVLTLVPKPDRPVGVPEGWLKITDAAIAYDLPLPVLEQRIMEGRMDYVSAGAMDYVPPPSPAPEIVTETTGRWVSVAEAAAHFGITPTTVRERITAGQLQGRKVTPPGKRWQWEVLVAAAPAPEPEALRPDDPRCADPDGLARLQTQLAQFEDQVAEEVRAAQEAAWCPNPTKLDAPPAGWIKFTAAVGAYGLNRNELNRRIARGELACCLVRGMGKNGSVRYVPPPAPVMMQEPPATGPLPETAPLSDYGSPTIEVQHTPPSDDHLLAPDDPPLAPPSEMRLLGAMQRIGYLEAQVEHWQARAAELEQQLADCETAYTHLTQPRRRWLPFGR